MVSRFWSTAEKLVLRTPLRRTLLTAPRDDPDLSNFPRLVQSVDDADGAHVQYDAAGPKHAFLRYLLEHRPVLLHGTGDASITRFEPRRQTDYDNEWANAVFATDDPIWPIFFAVVNRPVAQSLVNACSRRYGESHYYFSIGTDPRSREAWRSGWIYVLPREAFRLHPSGPEWLSPVAVEPLARLAVEPADFPFLEDVVQHTRGEPVGRIVLRATLGRALRR
ncbi:MAG: hypothetical protein ACJ74X_03210 [Gaiellaceae bacterium]